MNSVLSHPPMDLPVSFRGQRLDPEFNMLAAFDQRLPAHARADVCVVRSATRHLILVTDPVSAKNQVVLNEVERRMTAADIHPEIRRLPAGGVTESRDELAAKAEVTGDMEKFEAQLRFESLLIEATALGASDIHLTIQDQTTIQVRVHGEIMDLGTWSRQEGTETASVAYSVLGGITDVTFDPARRQDANVAFAVGDRKFLLRYSHAPIYPEGLHLGIRILIAGKAYQFAPSLAALGYTETQCRLIEEISMEPSGLLIISGETGSGKSTTLANLLHGKVVQSDGRIVILTVEDPPEYAIPGVRQSPVGTGRAGDANGFVGALRSAMRRDPDILMIGEIRDLDTAVLAAQCAQSGHLVFSTVHASRALNIPARMAGLGAAMPTNPVTRAVIAAPGFLAGLIHQVLVPILCTACKVPLSLEAVDPRLIQRLESVALDPATLSVRGSGCERCRGQGVQGRTVCAEVILPTPSLRKLLLEGRDEEAFQEWLKDGGYSIWHHAIDLIRGGEVSPEDVEEALGVIRREGPDRSSS